MFSSGWRYIAGALSLVLIAGQGYCQEPKQQAEERTEAEQDAPSQLSIPFPVVIIESEEAAVARERSEEKARQQQERDLVAQERMASAAELMNYASWASAILVLVGTVLLWWNLSLTRKAVEVTQTVGEQQSRAYIYVSGGRIAIHESGAFALITISNAGYSAAIVTSVGATLRSGSHEVTQSDALASGNVDEVKELPQKDDLSSRAPKRTVKYLVPPGRPHNGLLFWEESDLIKTLRYMAKNGVCDARITGEIKWINVATNKEFVEKFSMSALDPAGYFTAEGPDRYSTLLFPGEQEIVPSE